MLIIFHFKSDLPYLIMIYRCNIVIFYDVALMIISCQSCTHMEFILESKYANDMLIYANSHLSICQNHFNDFSMSFHNLSELCHSYDISKGYFYEK